MNGVANLALAGRSTVGEIAIIDLKAQQRRIRGRIEARLQAVLDHGRYIAGPEIEELEAYYTACENLHMPKDVLYQRILAAAQAGFLALKDKEKLVTHLKKKLKM